MSSSTIEKKIFIDFDKELNNERLQTLIAPSTERFKRIIKSYTSFNLFFLFIILAEVAYLFFYLTFFVQTFAVAMHLALIFATVFSYFTLRLYFQTQKTENCLALRSEYIQSIKGYLNDQAGIAENHLNIAKMCCKLAAHLHGKECEIYVLPSWLNYFSSLFEKGMSWCYWQDVHFMKEILLLASIDEHTKMVQLEPTNLEVHVGLANAYVMLSGLYVDPRQLEGADELWLPYNKYHETFKQKFRAAAERAIEEFKILNDYAPNDPWVHAQLAFSYHDLQMPKEEIKAYESILQLCPEDKETLFKLGKLYFEEGHNAKGLQAYENLKKSNYKKAESLIQYYGAYAHSKQLAEK